jgi:hypothetical protein
MFSLFQGLNGGTTVAGTVIVSNAVGIKVFATGIIFVSACISFIFLVVYFLMLAH